MAEAVSKSAGDITAIRAQIDNGNQDAVTDLMDIAYDELRELAQALMRREAAEHTLQLTALVHEAAMRRLRSGGLEEVGNRSCFFTRCVAQCVACWSITRGAVRQRDAEEIARKGP